MLSNKKLADMFYHKVLEILKREIRVTYKGEDFIPEYIYHKAADQIRSYFKLTLDLRTPADDNTELMLGGSGIEIKEGRFKKQND